MDYSCLKTYEMDSKLSYENSIKSIVSPVSENRYIVLSLN